jgi:hypothetical protein
MRIREIHNRQARSKDNEWTNSNVDLLDIRNLLLFKLLHEYWPKWNLSNQEIFPSTNVTGIFKDLAR